MGGDSSPGVRHACVLMLDMTNSEIGQLRSGALRIAVFVVAFIVLAATVAWLG